MRRVRECWRIPGSVRRFRRAGAAGGFAGAVVADEPDAVAFLERHRDVAERFDDDDIGVVAADGSSGLAEEGLLERAGFRVEDREVDARVLRVDADWLTHVFPLDPVGTRARYLRSARIATAQPTTVKAMTMYQWYACWSAPMSGARMISR